MADDRNESDEKPRSEPEPIYNNEQWWLRFVPNTERWSDVNISRFLSIYKTHPLLWDPTHSFYGDQSRRMKAYSFIASTLNLCGIGKGECIKLVESLRDLYTEEKKRQINAQGCNRKHTSPTIWYPMLERIIEIVQRKVANPVIKDSPSIEAESPEPWKACCPQIHTEDIWTPQHFKTNVIDWFFTSLDEQLICTCEKVAETNFDDICSTGSSSIFYGDSINDSISASYRCPADKRIHSSEMCCPNTQVFKSPDQHETGMNSDERQRCEDWELRKKEDMSSFCTNCTISGTMFCKSAKHCPSANTSEHDADILSCCSEAMSNRVQDLHAQEVSAEETCCGQTDGNSKTSKTDKRSRTKKRQSNQEKKLVPCEDSKTRLTAVCEEEHDVLDACGRKCVDEKSLDGSEICPKKNTLLSENRKMSLEGCGDKYHKESLQSSELCRADSSCPCEHKNLQNFRMTQVTACGHEGSSISSKTKSADPTESLDTHFSNSNKIQKSFSHSSSSLSGCRSLSEKKESDHRLDFRPDPTLCAKCAVDRVSVRKARKNITHFEDPRMPELDKYCRYKDWDTIYNTKTQVQDEEPIFLIDQDLLLTMRYKDEPPRPGRQNHLPTEADINLFTDSKPSKGRQVGLNNEFKREYGLNIQIDQPEHYACDIFDTPRHNPTQLML